MHPEKGGKRGKGKGKRKKEVENWKKNLNILTMAGRMVIVRIGRCDSTGECQKWLNRVWFH